MADKKKTELATKSDQLLDTLNRLKDTERQKREEPISSDEFHRLANEVDAISHEVFYIARVQDHLGEQIPTSDESIEDVKDDGHAPQERVPGLTKEATDATSDGWPEDGRGLASDGRGPGLQDAG